MQETQETRVQSLGWKMPWSRNWQPTPVFLPGQFHEQRSLVGTVHGVSQSWTRQHTHSFFQGSGNVTHLKSAVQAICNRTLITRLTHVAFIILKKFWILKGLSVTVSRGSQVMKSVRTVFNYLSPSTNRLWNFLIGFSSTFFICVNINHKKNTKDLWAIMKGQILFQVSYVHYHI